MRSLPFPLPTLTVGMIFSTLNAVQNIVNSLKLECSEYGTPKHLALFVDPRWGERSFIEYVDFQDVEYKMLETLGVSRREEGGL